LKKLRGDKKKCVGGGGGFRDSKTEIKVSGRGEDAWCSGWSVKWGRRGLEQPPEKVSPLHGELAREKLVSSDRWEGRH
jgi:hypothetical protein